VQQRCGILTEFDSMSDEHIQIAIERLADNYPKDLSFEFYSEFCQCICWYKEQSKEYSRKVLTGIAQHIFRLLHTNGVYTAFPNTEVIFRIFLSLMSTKCSGERSFSQLARIKNVKRSTMSHESLGVQALLCIEREPLHETDFTSVTDEFAAIKSRKVTI